MLKVRVLLGAPNNKMNKLNLNLYTAAVLELRQSLKNYPEVIAVIEDDFIADSIIVILDSKRFDIVKFNILIPSTYEGYNLSTLDIYSYVKDLQSILDDLVLNEPLLWEIGSSLEIIERPLNYCKKFIREYEHDLEC